MIEPFIFDLACRQAKLAIELDGGDGYGHGVYATGPARLVVSEFRVE